MPCCVAATWAIKLLKTETRISRLDKPTHDSWPGKKVSAHSSDPSRNAQSSALRASNAALQIKQLTRLVEITARAQNSKRCKFYINDIQYITYIYTNLYMCIMYLSERL